jgi:hypothetical protein
MANLLSERTLLLRLWRKLGRRRRYQFAALLILIVMGALSELVTVGAVLPFLSVFIAPDQILQHRLGAWLARQFAISSGASCYQ